MENPATWGEAEWVVNKVLNDHSYAEPSMCGLSVERQITDALRNAGLLKEGK